MPNRIVWDETGKRFYQAGVKNAVLYPNLEEDGSYSGGVAWNGITALTESPSGAEPTPLYADDIKYLNLMSAEDFAATLEAYTYPEEFEECDGSTSIATGITIGQQKRKPFALSYKTSLGNDIEGVDYGYLIHIIYNAVAAPSEKSRETINEDPDALTLSYELSTTPVNVKGYKPTAHLTIDSTKVPEETLKKLEDILYGSSTEAARCPLPDEIITLAGPDATEEVAGPDATEEVVGPDATEEVVG